MDLEYYDKWNNSEKDKYFIVSLIMDSKNKQKKTQQNESRLVDTKNKWMAAR